jgi:hypothetical protein
VCVFVCVCTVIIISLSDCVDPLFARFLEKVWASTRVCGTVITMASVAAPPAVSPTANMSDVSLTMPEVTTPLFSHTCGCAMGCAWMTSSVACRTHKHPGQAHVFLSVFAGASRSVSMPAMSHGCALVSWLLIPAGRVCGSAHAKCSTCFVDIHSSGDERLSVSRTHTLLIEPSSHCFTACLDDAAVRVHPKPTCQHYASTRWPRPGGWPATAGTACHSCPRPNMCEGHACHMGCGGLSVACIAHCM